MDSNMYIRRSNLICTSIRSQVVQILMDASRQAADPAGDPGELPSGTGDEIKAYDEKEILLRLNRASWYAKHPRLRCRYTFGRFRDSKYHSAYFNVYLMLAARRLHLIHGDTGGVTSMAAPRCAETFRCADWHRGDLRPNGENFQRSRTRRAMDRNIRRISA